MNAAATSSASSSSSPDRISVRGHSSIASATRSSSGRVRLAAIVLAAGGGAVRRSSRSTRSSRTPFAAAFARVASKAARSLSTAATGAKPSRAAAIASTPDPQPRSANDPAGSSSSSSSRLSLVVACAPVPNAWPGSIARSSVPGHGSAQGGRTSSGSAARQPRFARRHEHGLVEALPALCPVVGHRLAAHSHAHAADLCLAVGQRRQLARRAVQRVLDISVAVDLLHSARRQLQ